MVILHLLLGHFLCFLQAHIRRLACQHLAESLQKEVAVEGLHGVVPCYLFVYARDDLFLYLLTNLQSGTVCLQLFAFGFRERSVKTFDEVCHIGGVHVHTAGDVVFQSLRVSHTHGITERVYGTCIHPDCFRFLGFFVFSLCATVEAGEDSQGKDRIF